MTDEVIHGAEGETIPGYTDVRKKDLLWECWSLHSTKLKAKGVSAEQIDTMLDMYFGGAATVMHYIEVCRKIVNSVEEGDEGEQANYDLAALIMRNMEKGIKRFRVISELEDFINSLSR
jgi:hypothetical protein